jgi:hypothetical protein
LSGVKEVMLEPNEVLGRRVGSFAQAHRFWADIPVILLIEGKEQEMSFKRLIP